MIETPCEPLVRTTEIIMPIKLGFHLRIVAGFVKCSQQFQSTIRVRKGIIKADGKSMIGLLLLAVTWKSKIRIEAEGDDAEQAIEEINSFFRKESSAVLVTERHANTELSEKVYEAR